MRPTQNTTCYAYDALHRQTAVTYPSGPYASITPPRHFVYDSATVNGQTMHNANGRLAEAYTGTGSPKITDLGFNYTQRGELADAWQWSTNSTGWYHAAATYWPNGPTGLLNTLTALGLPTWTYNPDGEGRVNSVLAGTGNLVSSTQYNNYQSGWLPMIVNYGSGDKDTFTFDTNTGRKKQYQASVSTYTVTGNLTWNGNGSLGQLQIADTAYSANSQTCAYQHDDLARISSVDCGSGHWGQTFTYDAFGNITKTAMGNGRSGGSFWPGYDSATNHFTCTGCNYDNNGNLINDGPVPPGNTYSWDAEGNLSQFNSGGTIVYDALGRRVEQPGVQIVYGIDGGKLALMNHQTVSKAFAPLPAGSAAVYTGSTLAWYRHPDWLGSSWITSLASGTDRRSRDVSYSPFGDIAAENGPGTADHNFTGQNQDLTSILYDFPAREYSQGEGRWISPDPAGIAAVDPGNPQSWNRYAYANNNPLSLIDPTGMDPSPSLIEYMSRVVELGGCLYLQMGTRTQYVDPVRDQKVYDYAWGGMSLLTCTTSGTGPHGPGGGGANNGRKCTPSPSSGIGQSLMRTATAALLTGEFFSGLGPSDVTFGPDSAASQGMASSDAVQTALNDYAVTGRTSGLYTFDAPNVIRTGINSMGQFVGSATWTITPVNGGIELSLSNYTSVWSGSYHKLRSHARKSFRPLGTTHQTYSMFVPCGG